MCLLEQVREVARASVQVVPKLESVTYDIVQESQTLTEATIDMDRPLLGRPAPWPTCRRPSSRRPPHKGELLPPTTKAVPPSTNLSAPRNAYTAQRFIEVVESLGISPRGVCGLGAPVQTTQWPGKGFVKSATSLCVVFCTISGLVLSTDVLETDLLLHSLHQDV